jgi:hypothetical protein
LAVSVLLVAVPAVEFHSRAAPVRHTLLNSRINQIKVAIELIRNDNPSIPYTLNRQRLPSHYYLSPSTLELLDGHTVDIFTIDAALAGYYASIKWHPRPTIQSYPAYTAYLDMLNERHLSKKDAPEFLLYAPVEFDQKSAVFFEPSTYRKILTDYRLVAKDGVFQVLKRKDMAKPVPEERYAPVTASLGGSIPFPMDDRYYMFARIYVKYNILGKIIRVLYRAPNLYIQFYRGGFPTYRYKFCFNAVNGIDLGHFAAATAIGGTTNEFAIVTPYPVFFDKKIRVEFFRILAQ